MKSADLLAAGWKDITGSFDERERYLEMASRGQAMVRRLHDGWFGKLIICERCGHVKDHEACNGRIE